MKKNHNPTLLESYIFSCPKSYIATGKFTVEDKAYFFEKVTMYDKLSVAGNINGNNNFNAVNNVNAGHNVKAANNVVADNNVNVGNKLNVSGTSNLNGDVKMPNLSVLNNLNNPNLEILIQMPNGSIRTRSLTDLVTPNIDWLVCDQAFAANPYWISMANKLYTVCPDVKVGINSSDPQHHLTVNGDMYGQKILVGNSEAPTDAMINGYRNNISGDFVKLGQQLGSGNATVFFKIDEDGSVEIHSESGPALAVYSTNNYKVLQLEEDGLLRTREVRVDLQSWPDYVFDKDYELMSLKELSRFIEAHGHLPNMPSAKEMENGNVGLGEIQTKQMEKIEELTLYMLQLNEQMEQMQSEIDELREENRELKEKLD